jgi:copper chaperone CopZ
MANVVTIGRPHQGNGKGEPVGTVPLKPDHTEREKGAWLATGGAFFTAIVGSACCWLPLLLIAFGFSAAGVGNFFEQYRPYPLTATFALLGLAWYLIYRTALQRAWRRRMGKQGPSPAVEACCASESLTASTHSCCPNEPNPVDCCSPQTRSASGVRQRFLIRQFNLVMLWVATVVILLFALFPQWVGLILGSSGTQPTETTTPADEQQVVLKLDGMTCEGCAATVQQALRKVPGVIHVEVNYTRSEALVTTDKCCSPSLDPLIRAVRDAGYDAQVKK